MKGALRRKAGRSGLELIEQATHLLRTAPTATLAIYYLGTIPFVLGFLFFWADASRNPFADEHLVEAAWGMTMLFVWMRFCQSLFGARIRAQLAAEPVPRWSLRQHVRILSAQIILQPAGLILIPLAIIPVLPVAWVIAFFQNANVLSEPDTGDLSKLIRRSWKQALLWPMQNHVILLITFGFGFFILLNWMIVCLTAPGLLKLFLGIETIFSKSPMAMWNTTFFTSVLGLTYLCVDPILRTVYALRCFFGESLQSGEDLKVDLKRHATLPSIAAALAILISLPAIGPVIAQESQPAAPASGKIESSVSPSELDRRIGEVIRERKYTWRMPREKVAAETQKGPLSRFFANIGKLVRDAVKWLADFIDRLFQRKTKSSGQGGSWGGFIPSQVLLFVLIATVLCALAVFLIRIWRGRRMPTAVVATEALQPAPDLSDENVAADQLPEDGWTRLGHELLERGEFRLAMRAFYLASLAHLAQRNLVSIARFKSNHDYEIELSRRAHAIPELLPIFGQNVSVFERIWYGLHDVNGELVQQFAADVEKLRSMA